MPAMRLPLASLLAFAALAAAGSAAAATRAETPVSNRLARALRVPHVSPRYSAALAVDLLSGEQLFALNDSRPLAPASNEKLPVTYALLALLGPSFRIETKVVASGDLTGSTLHGRLVLVGGGDPSLSRADLRALARSVRAGGIRRVTGGVLGDESLFDTKRVCAGWKPSFYMNESPPLSALVVDRAQYRGRTSRNPARAAALLFRDALREAGVTVGGRVWARRAPNDATIVASSESARLGRLVRFMDQQSDNFTAEILLKQLSLKQAERGSTAVGAQVVMRVLADAGIPTRGVRIVDGSGLSRDDRLTADAIVAILQALHDNRYLGPVFMRALPVAGRTGTLRHRMRQAPLLGNVRAKTGTTSEASALAGFVRGRYAFAIIQNGWPLSYWWAREAQDRFATVLATQ